jgi:WD40 repeat protein
MVRFSSLYPRIAGKWRQLFCGSRAAVSQGPTRTVVGLPFSPDGRRPASWVGGRANRLGDTGPGAPLPVLGGHRSYVYPVAYTADARRIASGAWDCTVPLWDAATGEAVAALP